MSAVKFALGVLLVVAIGTAVVWGVTEILLGGRPGALTTALSAVPARAGQIFRRNDTTFVFHRGELLFIPPAWNLPSRAGRCSRAPASTRAEDASSTSPARPPSAGARR